ncbi:MAG: nuclear transport factor 2 family protein [Cyclobacteriaceae bacterium]
MKNYTNFLIAIYILCTFSCSPTKDKSTETTTGAQAISKEKVQNAVRLFNDALVTPTKGLLDKLCSEELSYGHSSGTIQTKSEFIEDLINGPFKFLSVATSGDQIQIFDQSAIVRHIISIYGSKDGNPIDIKLGNIMVFTAQKDGSLKLLARQAYKL